MIPKILGLRTSTTLLWVSNLRPGTKSQINFYQGLLNTRLWNKETTRTLRPTKTWAIPKCWILRRTRKGPGKAKDLSDMTTRLSLRRNASHNEELIQTSRCQTRTRGWNPKIRKSNQSCKSWAKSTSYSRLIMTVSSSLLRRLSATLKARSSCSKTWQTSTNIGGFITRTRDSRRPSLVDRGRTTTLKRRTICWDRTAES